MPVARTGVSGWRYPGRRGVFSPPGLCQCDELSYLSARMATVAVNGSFWSLRHAIEVRHESYELADQLGGDYGPRHPIGMT